MGLLEKIRTLGCRLRLVQITSRAGKPKKIATRSVTLRQLTTELNADNMRVLAESPVELTISFQRIFEAAGIVPPSNDCTIEQFAELFRSKPLEKMSAGDLRKTIFERLIRDKITVDRLVGDAAAKAQALDAFESFVTKKIEDRSSVRLSKLLELDREISKLRQDQDRLQQDQQGDQKHLSDWRKRKNDFAKEITRTAELLMGCEGLAMEQKDTGPAGAN